MSDPYRSAGAPCAHCKSTMRAFGERLICDACSAILIPLPELEKAISQGAATVADTGGAKDRECPRCSAPLVTSTITVFDITVPAMRCGTHGVWFDSTVELEKFFRGFPAAGSGGGYGGGGTIPSGHLGMVGHAQAFIRDVQTGLSIQHWWERKPKKHTIYKSPHGEAGLACPSCGGELALQSDRWACTNCGGAFVDNQPLVDMMMEMAHTGWQPPPLQGTPSRPCPVCKQAMLAGKLEAVPVERCGAHGVWFGPDALRAALLHAAGV